MSLTWKRVDLGRRMLWVELTKDDEPREIPLSKYAARYLVGLARYLNTPYLFVNIRTGTNWVNPDKSLRRAAEPDGVERRISRSETIPIPRSSLLRHNSATVKCIGGTAVPLNTPIDSKVIQRGPGISIKWLVLFSLYLF